MHLPRGLPTASWEETSGTHQAGMGLETKSVQPPLVIPSVCPSHNVQAALGAGTSMALDSTIIHTHCTWPRARLGHRQEQRRPAQLMHREGSLEPWPLRLGLSWGQIV